MEEEIHDTNRDEHPSEKYMLSRESDEELEHQEEKDCPSDETSFDKLLDIPTLRYIFYVLAIDCFLIHIL